MTASWRLVSKILKSYLLSKVSILQGSHTARRTRVGTETVKAPKKVMLTLYFSAGSSGLKSCPLSTSETSRWGRQCLVRSQGQREDSPALVLVQTGGAVPLSSRELVAREQSCQHRGPGAPHSPSRSAVFPWTHRSGTACSVLWRSKPRCPE